MIKKIKDKNNPLAISMNIYLSHLQFERRLSENTVSAYGHDLKRYIKFLFIIKNIKSPSKIEYTDIEVFIKNLLIQKKEINKYSQPKYSSLIRFVSSIRGYHKYLLSRLRHIHNPYN